MRIIKKERGYFRGTHKGAEIEIERAGPFEDYEFYIRVRADNGDGGYLYDGYAPSEVTTMAAAKREAIRGACLDEIPAPTDAEKADG